MKKKLMAIIVATLLAVAFVAPVSVASADGTTNVLITNDWNVGWQVTAGGNYYDINDGTTLKVGGLMNNVVGFTSFAPYWVAGNSNSSVKAVSPAGETSLITLITTNPSYGVWDANKVDISGYGENAAIQFWLYVYNDAIPSGADFTGNVKFYFCDYADPYANNMDAARWGTVEFGTWSGNILSNGKWNLINVRVSDITLPVWDWASKENGGFAKNVVGVGVSVTATEGTTTTYLNDIYGTENSMTAVLNRMSASAPSVTVENSVSIVEYDGHNSAISYATLVDGTPNFTVVEYGVEYFNDKGESVKVCKALTELVDNRFGIAVYGGDGVSVYTSKAYVKYYEDNAENIVTVYSEATESFVVPVL
ncbi:MAG: hypothetical protein ACI4S9_08550 [Christensenellales bacterium]